jgi:signal transduction histidine kinase
VRLSRLPLRARLVAGFVGAMIVVLVGAGAFVYWRVQYALDHRLDEDLTTQTADLGQAAARMPPDEAMASLRGEAREAQLLTAGGRVLASGPDIASRRPLISPEQAQRASRARLHTGRGYLFSKRGAHLRILAVPIHPPPGDSAAVAVTAVRLDQRDEALRELLAQLTIANLLALALAAAVGYRLARAALDPVERYRVQAAQITQGAAGVRLDVPDGPHDEITRLGTTLNEMLAAQERSAERQRQFIDDASHELRTPLSTLSAEIELALRKPRTADEHEATLRRIAIDTSQLVDLAGTLLTLGALGSTVPAAREIAARDLLDAAADRARIQLNGKQARHVKVDVPDALITRGDPGLLHRALDNLVDNAVRYGEGEITLTASAIRGDSRDAPACRYTVHDIGSGMSSDFLPLAAERFRQEAPSRSGNGAGLGLSLVDAVLTAHHGQLRICSGGNHHHQPTVDHALARTACHHPNRGTTITMLLPGFGDSNP